MFGLNGAIEEHLTKFIFLSFNQGSVLYKLAANRVESM